MPELPEIHGAARLINQVAANRFFRGPVVRSEVSKPAPFEWNSPKFRIEASARGKEMQMILKDEATTDGKALLPDVKLTFNFGMSGRFSFDRFDAIPKHAHLQFTSTDSPPQVLSFVDYRRFGKWVLRDYDETRGPDPVLEYKEFRRKVLSNLSKTPFSKAICETIMDQNYFNGIGNYLRYGCFTYPPVVFVTFFIRAEILYRAKIPPFSITRAVLENLPLDHDVDRANPDVLDLCHIVPQELFGLGKPGEGYRPDSDGYAAFKGWLQCYMVDGMKNLVDRQSRTIWFAGDPGPLVPTQKAVRHKGSRLLKKDDTALALKTEDESDDDEQPSTSQGKKKSRVKQELSDEKDPELLLPRPKRAKTASAKSTKVENVEKEFPSVATKTRSRAKKTTLPESSASSPKKEPTEKTRKVRERPMPTVVKKEDDEESHSSASAKKQKQDFLDEAVAKKSSVENGSMGRKKSKKIKRAASSDAAAEVKSPGAVVKPRKRVGGGSKEVAVAGKEDGTLLRRSTRRKHET